MRGSASTSLRERHSGASIHENNETQTRSGVWPKKRHRYANSIDPGIITLIPKGNP